MRLSCILIIDVFPASAGVILSRSVSVGGYSSVFPASAGVILKAQKGKENPKRFPRIRGGDPKVYFDVAAGIRFSPHPRG